MVSVVLPSVALFFLVAWVFLVEKLSGDYDIEHTPVKLLFACTFAASCFLFQLIIFEIMGAFDEQ